MKKLGARDFSFEKKKRQNDQIKKILNQYFFDKCFSKIDQETLKI